MSPKIRRIRTLRKLFGKLMIFSAGAALAGYLAFAQSAPQPVLTLALTGTNQFQISITNAVASTNYEIYRTPLLGHEAYFWKLHMIGSLGQSNFVVEMGADPTGWFRAGVGTDADYDGVENFRDGDPNNTNIRVLSITIDSPLNGSTFQ